MTRSTKIVSVSVTAATGTAPSWWTNDAAFPVGSWTTVAATGTISAVAPSPAPPGASGQRSVCDTWTGGCVDQSRRALVLAANGGHQDYSGNEIYELLLGAETPVWARINNPSTPNTGSTNFSTLAYSDGNIRSLHSRNNPQFVNGKVWLPWCDGAYETGSFSSAIWSFDRTALTWTSHGVPFTSSGNQNFEGACSTYDPVGGRFWVIGSDGALSNLCALFSFSPSNPLGTYAQHTCRTSDGSNSSSWAVVATQTSPRVLIYGARTSGLRVCDISSGNPTSWVTPTVSGSPTGITKDAGAVYVPGSNCVLVYHHSYGSSIRKLSIPSNPITGTYTWSTITPTSGATPPGSVASDYNGPHSKFNIISDMGDGRSALVLVNRTIGPTFVYKLPAVI